MRIHLRFAANLVAVISLLAAGSPVFAATTTAPRMSRRTLHEEARNHAEAKFPRLDLKRTSCPTAVTYARTSGFGDFHLEIPFHWSYYYKTGIPLAKSHSNVLRFGFLHVAQDKVYPGMFHGPQVDFIKMPGIEVQKFMRQLKTGAGKGNIWSKELIDGRTADVLEFPLAASGKVTKDATGGKYYFLRWEAGVGGRMNAKKDVGLMIWKHAKGDADFECGVNHMLSELDLDALTDVFGKEFPGK